jgi:hypothetical protein
LSCGEYKKDEGNNYALIATLITTFTPQPFTASFLFSRSNIKYHQGLRLLVFDISHNSLQMALPTSKNQAVLITGVNGYIASRTAEAFLNEGYNVRGTVRNKNSAAGLLEVLEPFVTAGRLEIVEVKDSKSPAPLHDICSSSIVKKEHIKSSLATQT